MEFFHKFQSIGDEIEKENLASCWKGISVGSIIFLFEIRKHVKNNVGVNRIVPFNEMFSLN